MFRRSFGTDRYSQLADSLRRNGLTSRLTLAEKILYSHVHTPIKSVVRGETYLKLNPDRVAMQDASAQTALLQFMLSKKASTAVPASVHCDHLIEAHVGADSDLASSITKNNEIFDFLSSASRKYGIDFCKFQKWQH